MSTHNTPQIMDDLREVISTQSRELEIAQKKHEASRKAERERNQAIIDQLDARLAEIQRYEQMNPFQRFFYRIFKNPSWL